MKSTAVLFAVCFLIAAVFFAWMGFVRLPEDQSNIKLGIESVNWPTTTALITDSYIDAEQGTDNRTRYVPRVKYSFKVDQQERTSSQISFSRAMEHSSYDRDIVDAIRGHYPSMSTHTVFYSPTDKNVSVLVPGFNIPEVPLPSMTNFLMAANFFLNVFSSLILLSRPTKMNQIIFCVFLLGGSVVAVFGCAELQRQYLQAKIPKASILKVDTDGFFIGGKKYTY